MARAVYIALLALACGSATAERSSSLVAQLVGLITGNPQRVASPPLPPTFPSTYTVTFQVSLPHLYLTQPEGLKFPVTVWRDGAKQRMRVEVLGGLDTVLNVGDTEYSIYPRINETRCGVFEHGPVRGASNELDSVLPDLTGWDFAGEVTLSGGPAHIWQYQHKSGEKISQYTFYTSMDGKPLKFLMIGINYLTGGHYDEYNYEFTHFSTKLEWPAPAVADDRLGAARRAAIAGETPFTPPSICDIGGTAPHAEQLSARHPVAAQLHALTPRIRGYDQEAAYHAFARASHPEESAARPHTAHSDVYASRLAQFTKTVAAVQAHNVNPDKLYTQKVHRWADWTQQEFMDVMLPNRARKAALAKTGLAVSKIPDAYKPLGVFHRRLAPSQLPHTVDWRGTGADPGVKDQGMCGSCFSFAATGSMEGVWYVETGQHRSFSEQQILDCAWDWGPNGCGGGDYQPAFNYVAREGIALEQEYPYVSNDDFCRSANISKPGKFMGFMQIPGRDELTLMEAVFTLGPIAVAVDASWESFRAYGEGVYDEPDCATSSADLDHAVLLFGYGTTDDGIDYWLVRNSWAKFYGDDGYIKIRRGKRDCGISTDPAAAVVREDYVVQGMAASKRLEAVKRWH